MDLTSIIVQLIGGAIGGGASGKAVKDSDLGNLGNIIAGAIGGLGGGSLAGTLVNSGAAAAGSLDIASLATQLVGGGVGGAILQVVIGLIKNKVLAR